MISNVELLSLYQSRPGLVTAGMCAPPPRLCLSRVAESGHASECTLCSETNTAAVPPPPSGAYRETSLITSRRPPWDHRKAIGEV